jgi:hypothetical protein
VTAVALSGNSVAPGTLGFLVVFGMAVVLTLLFRSMSKHLRKVNQAARNEERASAPGTSASSSVDPAAGTGGTTPAGSANQRQDS